MDLDVSFYIHGLMECVKWNNINITKSILVAFRDMINSNNDILIKVLLKNQFRFNNFYIFIKFIKTKEILRKDLFHLIINILNTDSNFILIILNIIKQLALKQYFLVLKNYFFSNFTNSIGNLRLFKTNNYFFTENTE